jgi:hypothetical protein
MPSFSCRLAVVGDWCDLRKHLTNNELTDIVFAKPGPRAKMEEHILSSVEDQSGLSSTSLAGQHNISHSTVWRILKMQQLYPYHVDKYL